MRAYIKAASWGERQVFGLIRSGMHVSTAAVPALPQSDAEIEERPDDDAESLDAKMHGLLDRAVGQNTASTSSSSRASWINSWESHVDSVGSLVGCLVTRAPR